MGMVSRPECKATVSLTDDLTRWTMTSPSKTALGNIVTARGFDLLYISLVHCGLLRGRGGYRIDMVMRTPARLST